MKFLVKDDIHKVDLLQLLEKYENTNELALATTAGMGFIVRMWVKQGEDLSPFYFENVHDLSKSHNIFLSVQTV